MNNKFKWRRPKITDDGPGGMSGGDDMDDDDRDEGDADVADMLPGGKNLDGDDSEEIDDEMEFNMQKNQAHDDVDLER